MAKTRRKYAKENEGTQPTVLAFDLVDEACLSEGSSMQSLTVNDSIASDRRILEGNADRDQRFADARRNLQGQTRTEAARFKKVCELIPSTYPDKASAKEAIKCLYDICSAHDNIMKQRIRLVVKSYVASFGNDDHIEELGNDEYKAGIAELHSQLADKVKNLEENIEKDPNSSKEKSDPYLALEKFVQQHGAEGLAAYARTLFPAASPPPNKKHLTQNEPRGEISSLPANAPEIYQGLRGLETPPQFVQRVYGQWLGRGLDRAHIKQLDPVLYQGIMNWSRKNAWPNEVDLPTRAEQNQRVLSGGTDTVREHLGKFTGDELLREAGRLRAAARNRQ